MTQETETYIRENAHKHTSAQNLAAMATSKPVSFDQACEIYRAAYRAKYGNPKTQNND